MAELIACEPATGEILWRGEPGDARATVAEARLAQPGWAALPQRTRTELLRRFANVVRAEAVPFTDLIARESGMPLWDAAAQVEAIVAVVEPAIAAQIERAPARRHEGELGTVAAVRHRPVGVLGVIAPCWEPARIAAGHVLPALLAGNAVVLKPSEKTPASAARLIALLHRAGVPEGVARLLPGGAETGAALAAADGIDGLFLTGSTATGRALHRALAGRPEIALVLHLGGDNPLIVWDAPDVQASARITLHSAFLGAGQRCTGARTLIVRDGQHGPLLTSLGRLIDRLIVGAPHDRPSPFLGPMLDADAAARVERDYAALVARGAQVLRPIERANAGGLWLTPALLDVTEIEGRTEPIEGPVLQVRRVSTLDTALDEAAHHDGPVTGLIGRDPAAFERLRTRSRSEAIVWNRSTHAATGGAPISARAADDSACAIGSIEAETPRLDLPRGLRED